MKCACVVRIKGALLIIFLNHSGQVRVFHFARSPRPRRIGYVLMLTFCVIFPMDGSARIVYPILASCQGSSGPLPLRQRVFAITIPENGICSWLFCAQRSRVSTKGPSNTIASWLVRQSRLTVGGVISYRRTWNASSDATLVQCASTSKPCAPTPAPAPA
jgi:hypothetical protein